MEEDKIKEILERYWLAETTVEEEKFIEQYMIASGTKSPFKDLFLAKQTAKNLPVPAADVERWPKVRKVQRLTYVRMLKIAAIILVLISVTTAVILIKQNNERKARAEAQKQLEADLTIMFNTVNDSYTDITSSAKHLTK